MTDFPFESARRGRRWQLAVGALLLSGSHWVYAALPTSGAAQAVQHDRPSSASSVPDASGISRAELERRREVAVRRARAGDPDAALEELETLYRSAPDSAAIRADLAVIAQWAGRDARTVALLETAGPGALTDTALASYAKATRNLGQWDRSLELYRQLQQRTPADPDPALAEVLVLADAGRLGDARSRLSALRTAPGNAKGDPSFELRLVLACGYLETRAGAFARALGCYQQALALDPAHPEALRGRVQATASLGAALEALRLAEATPQQFSSAELFRLRLDAAATHIRWADLPNPDDPLADARIARELHAGIPAVPESAPPAARAAWHYDRISALVANYRMEEAVTAFESLEASATTPRNSDAALPVYLLAAMGQAYLYLERPEDAIAAYQAALDQAPERFDLLAGLFYAHSDLQDHAEARALADRMLASHPAWQRPTPDLWLPDPRYPEARRISAMERAYRDRYAESLEELGAMLSVAPANSALRLARAQILQWRGWYREARAELDRVQIAEPGNRHAALQHGHLALDTRHFREAEQAQSRALEQAPRDRAAQILAERWERHNRPEVELRAGAGRSAGGAFEGREWHAEGFAFSHPLAYRYRAFVHDQVRVGRFDEGTGRDHRLGVGVEFRDPGWLARAEVHQGLEQNDEPGLTATALHYRSDRLLLDGRIDINSAGVPLRATRVGVTGDELQAGAEYRWHEARHARVRVGFLDLDDDNRRTSMTVAYQWPLLNAPAHKLYGKLNGYGSRNSEAGRSYYNPVRDAEFGAGLRHEWRIFRRYAQGLTQRIDLDAGHYWQHDFGGGPVWSVALEHEWSLGERLQLGYGVSFGGRIYDGAREHASAAHLMLRGRL